MEMRTVTMIPKERALVVVTRRVHHWVPGVEARKGRRRLENDQVHSPNDGPYFGAHDRVVEGYDRVTRA